MAVMFCKKCGYNVKLPHINCKGIDMKKLRLTLADDQGVVIAMWTIGQTVEAEYDVENLDVDPECNFYSDGSWNDAQGMGEEINREAVIAFNN